MWAGDSRLSVSCIHTLQTAREIGLRCVSHKPKQEGVMGVTGQVVTCIQWGRGLFEYNDIDSLVQDCSNSIANALELLQSCTEPSI